MSFFKEQPFVMLLFVDIIPIEVSQPILSIHVRFLQEEMLLVIYWKELGLPTIQMQNMSG